VAFGVALVILLGLGVWWGVSGVVRDDPTWEVADGSLPLDSFSQPSLALALLKQEAARLLAAYLQQRDQVSPAEHEAVPPLQDSRLDAAMAPVARLHRQIEELGFDLDCRLLWLYAENHRHREFLDRYLHLVQEAPRRTEVAVWYAYAFAAARGCGRSEELADALEHVVRFRERAGTVQTLAGLLEARAWNISPPVAGEGP
jgi:hypothetical protein